ncbi:RNA polymerase sigma factor [Actinoplanes sp. LDG1-06]|uniref:RNA polymerase sigma factor n=1 Tax=Paractinoplanes ovalisporus TaxID=2810368 RepID=A0ABS2A6M5_9ACTN|nr:RNA polymerase sigma factor [Actinoplanes ovalisporus]MBM2614929.1 RNA polymerase sigma factor [Actinoplanes ovalisporus]
MRERQQRQRYEEVYARTYVDLVRFVVRRGHPTDQAEDVVAEAFVVAWQRLKDLPADVGEARAWLFGITRRLLLAKQRSDTRGQALSVRIAGQAAVDGTTIEHDDLVATSVDLAHAWGRLTAMHQEALSLSVFEGLTGAQAAQVLGISSVAFRIRLSRARRLLKHGLGPPDVVVAAPDRRPADPHRMPTSSEKGYV